MENKQSEKPIKKALNYFAYILLFIMPVGWVIMYNSYTTWKLYKSKGYKMPAFLKFLYQHNFEPYISYKKNEL